MLASKLHPTYQLSLPIPTKMLVNREHPTSSHREGLRPASRHSFSPSPLPLSPCPPQALTEMLASRRSFSTCAAMTWSFLTGCTSKSAWIKCLVMNRCGSGVWTAAVGVPVASQWFTSNQAHATVSLDDSRSITTTVTKEAVAIGPCQCLILNLHHDAPGHVLILSSQRFVAHNNRSTLSPWRLHRSQLASPKAMPAIPRAAPFCNLHRPWSPTQGSHSLGDVSPRPQH